MSKKLTKKETKIALLYIGSPAPHPYLYQMSCIDLLFGKYSKWSKEKLDKEHKRRVNLYKKDCKEYRIQREKELDELEEMLKKENDGKTPNKS